MYIVTLYASLFENDKLFMERYALCNVCWGVFNFEGVFYN